MKRYCLVVLFVVAIVVANVLYVYYYMPRTHLVEQKIILGSEKPGYASLKLTAGYDIKVYRQGELIATRHKENDPITIQWYRLVADMMFGFIRDGAVNWIDTDGNQRTCIDTEHNGLNPKMYIALGSGTGTPSINDYKLFNEVTKDVAEMSVQDDTDNSQYIVTYTKSFTIVDGFTLTEVGLELYLEANNNNKVYLLFAHDSVSPSIDLVKGDVVTITYTITIPYNVNGPFTRWFYNGLINYFLGYRGTTDQLLIMKAENSTNGGMDLASGSGLSVYIEIGDSSSGINPLFETYCLGNKVQEISISDSQFLSEVNETSSFTIHYIVAFSFTGSSSINEIGVGYEVDIRTDNYFDYEHYLWLYWSLASPINVNAGDGLRVEITVEIPYT